MSRRGLLAPLITNQDLTPTPCARRRHGPALLLHRLRGHLGAGHEVELHARAEAGVVGPRRAAPLRRDGKGIYPVPIPGVTKLS